MAKWAEIKCERCAEQDVLWEGMERALEESDARETRLERWLAESETREATLNDRITLLEEHLCLTEEKLAKAVVALRGWIDFANAEGMPVLLSDLEAAELTGGKNA